MLFFLRVLSRRLPPLGEDDRLSPARQRRVVSPDETRDAPDVREVASSMRSSLRRLTPALLLLLSLLVCCGCQSSTVTVSGAAVTNQVLITGARAVHIAEGTAATIAEALTAQYIAGSLTADVLQTFQDVVAPPITAALTAARLALHTLQTAPDQTTTATTIQAVLELQKELTTLQGWYTTHMAIPLKGVSP